MDLTKLILAAVIGLLLLVWQGLNRTLLAAVMVCILFAGFVLTIVPSPDQEHIGIAHSDIGISGFLAAVLAGLVVLAWQRRLTSFPYAFVPVLIYVVFLTPTIWGGTLAQWSGVILIGTAVGAWWLGKSAGKLIVPGSTISGFLLTIISLVIVGETIVVLAQAAGLPVFALDGRTAAMMGDRVSGTYDHPATLGKVIVLLSVVLLPFLKRPPGWQRNLAWIALGSGLVPLMLSGGRANILAIAGVLGVWFWFDRPKFAPRFRIIGPVAIGVLLVAGAAVVIVRVIGDGLVGERGHFVEVALAQVSRAPLFGIGLNNYVSAVGPHDHLTSQGWPVHNIFLHMIVEIGIIGAALFFAPIVLSFVLAFRRRSIGGSRGAAARAYLALVPAILVIGMTGWALIANSIFILWFLVAGYLIGQFRGASKQDSVVDVPFWRDPSPMGRRLVGTVRRKRP